MAARRSITRTLAILVLFIGMEGAALSMLSHGAAMQRFFLAKGAHAFMAKTWGAAESVRRYFSLGKENDRLAQENFELARQLQEYRHRDDGRAMEGRTDSLRRMDASGDFRYMSADIVKISRNKQHNYMILGKGFADGVSPRSGVITRQGVIGIVDAVDRHYSYALSFMNTDISISARIGREGAVGPLVWDGVSTSGGLLREIPLQHRFQPGDTVYTSGYSSIFPADIPLGVTGESRIVNGATYEIRISLFQDFGALRYVTLVNNVGEEDIQALEMQEDRP